MPHGLPRLLTDLWLGGGGGGGGGWIALLCPLTDNPETVSYPWKAPAKWNLYSLVIYSKEVAHRPCSAHGVGLTDTESLCWRRLYAHPACGLEAVWTGGWCTYS